MSEPIRVAQIIGNANAGGVEAIIMNIYKNIDRTKYQFDFFVQQCCPIINREVIESMGGKIVIIPPVKNIFKYEKELTRLFKEGKYKIVHSNMNTLSVFSLRAAKKAGVKIRIAHSHSTASKKEVIRSMFKYMLRPFSKVYANYYFACSKKAGAWQFGDKTFSKGLIEIFPSSIKIENFKYSIESRDEIRNKFNIEKDTFVLGHVGRFVTVKNHHYILDIFKEVKSIQPNSKLLLVGDGPLKEEIIGYTKTLGIEKDVIFAGLFANTAPFYSAMDAFILPSLYEGLPVVGVEAQASGLFTIFSTAVTSEAKAIEPTIFMDNTLPAKQWAEMLLKHDYNFDRESFNKLLEKSEFNIANNSYKIMNKYTQYLKEQYDE